MEEKKLYVNQIRPFLYLLDEAHSATGYLVIGSEKACVIDTMCGECNLLEEVRKLTDKPLIVVNTHGHGDHIIGNVYFDEAYINFKDLPVVEMFTSNPEFIEETEKYGVKIPPFKEIKGGDTIDLGDKTLEVINLPGHTPGGILLLLKEDRILFTGDGINHHLWMQLDGCLPLHEYVKELDKVMYLENEADIILHGHARDCDDISLMRCLRDGIQEIVDGKTSDDEPYNWFGGVATQHHFKCLEGRRYQQDDHVICYQKDNI